MPDDQKDLMEANTHHAIGKIPDLLSKLEYVGQVQATAMMAAAIVANAGRPVSIKEVGELQRDLFFSMFAGSLQGHGAYTEWKKTADQRLAQPFR